MMWFLLLFIAHIEPVILQGEKRLILRNGNNPCEGHVEIYYNAKWGYIGDKYWSSNTEEVVCRSTHCGTPVKTSETEPVFRPKDSKVWLNEVMCKGNESHLWECDYPGWGISYYRKDTVKKVNCKNKIKISLDGFECAGAVVYSTDGENPSGYFCATNWGDREANFLCKSLGCGTSKEIVQVPWMGWKRFQSSKKMNTKCAGIENINSLWQCVTGESKCTNPASIICTGYKRLQLTGNTSNACSGRLEIEQNSDWSPAKNIKTTPDDWCRQMQCGANVSYSQDNDSINLTCTDNVKVVLKHNGNPSRCYGDVHIEVNAKAHPVCSSDWSKDNSQVVCRELNCGDMLQLEDGKSNKPGIMDHVKCSGKESSLWHCRSKRDKTPFTCSKNAYVVCKDSVRARLVDGPGKCAGRVEIQHEGRWKSVDKQGWTDTNSKVVCRQLNCGDKRKDPTPEKYSPSSGVFLNRNVNCPSEASKISDCTIGSPNREAATEAVGITCEEHMVVFLKGNPSCSGMVGIEKGSETYWLSGSNETWNLESANTVCRQVQCGEASHFSSTDTMKDVWNKTYSCSSNTTSLFECNRMTLPFNHSDTIATVTCSGIVDVKLTKGCYGHVNISVNGKSGGVCADTWTKEKSEMLCKDLGCGNPILRPNNNSDPYKVIFKSLHSTKESTNLNQCNFVANDKGDNICNPAYVVCSGSVKVKFRDSRDKCSGNVAMSYAGQWLPVCKDALNKETQNTICGQLKCGRAVDNFQALGPNSKKETVISEIQCPANGKDVTACNVTPKDQICTHGGLQCSEWSKMALKADSTCSGYLYIYSEGNVSSVSTDNLTKTEGELLCQDLRCGNFKSQRKSTWDTNQSKSFSCANNLGNIWDCKEQTKASQKQLFLKCEDTARVTLSEKCYGKVKINDFEVCDTHWNNNYSHMVCQEHDCSNAMVNMFSGSQPLPNAEYQHVICEDHHSNLGQCKQFKGKCVGKLVSINCIGNVKISTTEKCGGQIQVSYGNERKNVCPLSPLALKHKEKLCENLGCPGVKDNVKPVYSNKNEKVKLDIKLRCTEDHMDIRHCVLPESCSEDRPAEIYCNGYVPKERIKEKTTPIPIVPIILGVGLLLILVIIIVVILRVYIARKAKIASPEELDSGDYEDVTSKANEMEDFGRERFRSEAEGFPESDAQSNASFSYDDIDEIAESQPLTSQAATAGASGDNYIHDGARDQSTDGVTYEVDDPQENYDDIEASPEMAHTEVEVHDSPQTTPKSVAAPPGLVQEGEDYLVPGQDG